MKPVDSPDKLLTELKHLNQRVNELESVKTGLERALDALRESGEGNMPCRWVEAEAIISADCDGNIISWNRGAQSIFGYEEDEVLGRQLTLLLPIGEREAHRESLKRMSEMGQSEMAGKVVEMYGIRKDGSGFPIELSLSMWSRKENKFFTVIARDVSQRKLQEEELLRMEKLVSLEKLSAGASHEIINPINNISINIQLLLKYEDLKPAGRQMCQIMLEEIERIREVLDGLDTFAQQIKAELQLISIQSALSGALNLLDTKIHQHDVVVVEEFPPSPPLVKGNPFLLQQAFKKIMDNALEAMPNKGTLTLRVRKDIREEMPLVNVQISDTGPGISREHLKKIFDPFFTTREVGEGKGLGMSIAYGIVKHHGGSIFVDSVEGAGTTFTVELPIEQGEVTWT